ncbi:hypothetical protein [Micromonospora sp. WMMD1082]|uniref:hypothetical protein n=1 Tax=Micromonospora sp. WMMD1082 TaxID=3016104 RepID=UPI00241693C3|nr:hypothetical protein [Micromonospora sp. WMMD1082]MDG4798149.1 hypothetical protein [Micromonospora sp. WMMD1082]
MAENGIATLQRAVRDYFESLVPEGIGPAALAFEQIGRPLDPADFRARPGVPAGPAGAEETARLTNHTMRVSAGIATRTMLPLTSLQDFVLAAEPAAGLDAPRVALFERIKAGIAREYASSRQVSLYGPDEYVAVAVDPRRWYDADGGWTRYRFDTGSPPATGAVTDPPAGGAEQAWAFQLAEPELAEVLDQPPTATRELWQSLVEQPGPLDDPAELSALAVDRVRVELADLLDRFHQGGLRYRPGTVPEIGDRVDVLDAVRVADLAIPDVAQRAFAVESYRIANDLPAPAALADFVELVEVAERYRVVAAPRPVVVPVHTGRVTVDFEYQLVSVARDWWCAPLLELGSWHVPGIRRGQFSDGRSRENAGRAPTVPVAFLAVRDLRLTGTWTAQDRDALGRSMALGPFSLLGRSVNAQAEEVTVTVPGCQLVAWICETLPMLPPAEG